MFWHIFKNRVKGFFKNKETLIWTLIFPLILATLFKIAIPDANEVVKIAPFNIAVVNNEGYKEGNNLKSSLESASNPKRANRLFNLKEVDTKEDASKLLDEGKIEGYMVIENVKNPLYEENIMIPVTPKIEIFVKKSGVEQTIMNEFVNEFVLINAMYEHLIVSNPIIVDHLLYTKLESTNYLKTIKIANHEPNSSLNYYYALMAMACLFAGISGVREVTNVQADQSGKGSRISAAPINKTLIFMCNILVATLVQIVAIIILINYLIFILEINFSTNLPFVYLTAIAGTFAGVAFGALIGALVKGKEIRKINILAGLTMLMSFLSGLMYADMKRISETIFPPLKVINIAGVISNSFYSLYYYTTYTKYFITIGMLIGFTVIAYLIVCKVIRRQTYANI